MTVGAGKEERWRRQEVVVQDNEGQFIICDNVTEWKGCLRSNPGKTDIFFVF